MDSSAIVSLLALRVFGDVATCVENIARHINGVRNPDDLHTAVVESILNTFTRPGATDRRFGSRS